MIVVSDSSPLNYLVLIDQAQLLPALFGRVIAPPAVIAELGHAGSPTIVRNWVRELPPWLEVRTPIALQVLPLGRGESEALSLARELKADAVLIDERRGFLTATRLGLFATGTLGVLEIASERGLLRLADVIEALKRTSFRVTDRLLTEALAREARRSAESRNAEGHTGR